MHTRLTLLLRFIFACVILLALPGQAMGAITLTGPDSVPEGAGVATYTVTCAALDLPDTISVDPGPAPAATAGDDYGDASTLLIPCSVLVPTEHTVEVPIIDDQEDETNENFTVSTLVSGLSVETTIIDDDPVASITPVAFIVEGDSGTQMADLTVTLASAAAELTTIAYETEDFSAKAGPDYTATSGDLVFQVGQLSKTISVPVVGDAIPEGPEAFFVNLLTTNNGSLSPTAKQGGVGIFDNDTAGLPTVSIPKGASVREGDDGTGNILFDVTLSSAAVQRTEVAWKTGDWTADKSDYDRASGKVVFQEGQKSKTISVDVKGDRIDEPDEAFTVTLQNPVAAVLGTKKAAFGIIEDDDGPKMRIGKPKLRGGKKLVAKVTCPGTASGCKGKLVAKSRKLKLGRQGFDLEEGETKKLKLKLKRKAREALAEKRRRAKLKATARDDSGDKRVTTRKARLKRLDLG